MEKEIIEEKIKYYQSEIEKYLSRKQGANYNQMLLIDFAINYNSLFVRELKDIKEALQKAKQDNKDNTFEELLNKIWDEKDNTNDSFFNAILLAHKKSKEDNKGR